jgi:hypothetical protein
MLFPIAIIEAVAAARRANAGATTVRPRPNRPPHRRHDGE